MQLTLNLLGEFNKTHSEPFYILSVTVLLWSDSNDFNCLLVTAHRSTSSVCPFVCLVLFIFAGLSLVSVSLRVFVIKHLHSPLTSSLLSHMLTILGHDALLCLFLHTASFIYFNITFSVAQIISRIICP